MRFAYVLFAVLVCPNIYAQNKIDASHVTTPVSVVNFPEVQAVEGSVAVTNLPAVQAVAGTVSVSNLPTVQAVGGSVAVSNLPAVQTVDGTVSVGNLPAVQTVGGTVNVGNLAAVQAVEGTVNVGNLPLDVDGALRVTSAPARQMVWQDLISEPITFAGDLLLPTAVNTDGYSLLGVLVNDSVNAGVSVFWQWAGDEDFAPVADTRNGVIEVDGSAHFCGGFASARLVCTSTGGNARIFIRNSSPGTVTRVRVYLFP